MITKIHLLILVFLLLAPWAVADSATGLVSNQASYANGCPSGNTCIQFTLTCPQIAETKGVLAIGDASVRTRGVLVLFSGESGTQFYGAGDPAVEAWINSLRDDGWQTIRVRWQKSWWGFSGGLQSGMVRLSCRPATILKYVHETYYAPLGLGRGHFVATGNSAGSSQIAYALAYYGLESVIDTAILTAGPPHSALHKSCMDVYTEKLYWFNIGKRSQVDKSYAIRDNGPCETSNASWIDTWRADSVAYSGTDYFYPETRVYQIIGAKDSKMLTTAADYGNRLVTEETPWYTWIVVSDTPHAVYTTIQGRSAIEAALP